MRLKTNIQMEPVDGSSKSKIKFAFIPKRIGDIVLWLSRYEVLYIFKIDKVSGIVKNDAIEFQVGNWIKVSERPI